MATSKVNICNVALAMLKQAPIRSLEEDNKRARSCDVFFDSSLGYLLEKFDWDFARRLIRLQPLEEDDEWAPGEYGYALPSNCVKPRDIYPGGSKQWWVVRGQTLFLQAESTEGDRPRLYYTHLETDPAKFSAVFDSLLSHRVAMLAGPVLTQDSGLINNIREQYVREQNESWETGANADNDYRASDEDPENDTFVNPDGNADPLQWPLSRILGAE